MKDKIRRILWWFAGAESDILEKCKTDHVKFAGVGITVLMTSVIAFFAGSSAAWYFTQSGDDTSGSYWSFGFGLLWALLILSIDRSLVITLKKDPTLTRQKFLVPLLSRALLAFIIAFMISIPTELFIFKDFIKVQSTFFEADYINKFNDISPEQQEENILSAENKKSESKIQNIGKDIDELNSKINGLETKIKEEEDKRNNPTTERYQNAQNDKRKYNKELEANRKNLKNATTNEDSSKYSKNISKYKKKIDKCSLIINDEINKWNKIIDGKIKSYREEKDSYKDTQEKKDNDKKQEQDRLTKNTNKKDSLQEQRFKKHDVINKNLGNSNHFIQNYQILRAAVWRHKTGELENLGELLFLYMIRLFFFIIEILPTVVKIVTPIGSYEQMVHAEEKGLIAYLNSPEYKARILNMHDLEIKSHEEQLKKQHEIEFELKKEILEKVKQAQMEVAEATIKHWQEEEMSKLNSSEPTEVVD